MLLALLLAACALPEPPDPANCSPRTAFYPDSDGDGRGEPTAVFVGCVAPDGWVATLAPPDTGDTVDTGDSGAVTGETGGTGAPAP